MTAAGRAILDDDVILPSQDSRRREKNKRYWYQ